MFASLNHIEFFRRVRVGAIFSRKHLPLIVPAKTKRIAQSASIDFQFRLLLFWVQLPDRRRDRMLATLPEPRVPARFISIRSRTAVHVQKAIGSNRALVHAMIEW